MGNSAKIVLIALFVLLSSPTADISTSQAPKDETPATNNLNSDVKILLNFQDATLKTVLEYLSETAGLVIVSDDNLDHRLTVISRQPMTVNEAISLINSILKESGFAAVRMGRTLRIVSLAQAKTMNIPVTSGNDPGAITPGDDVVTHVIPIRYASAARLRENLTPLIPEYAQLEANEDGNVLIITDTTANIKRLIEIVQALDTHMSAVAVIRVFQLKYADAKDVAELINRIFQQEEQQRASSTQQQRGPFEMMMQFGGGSSGGGPGGGPGTRGGPGARGGRAQRSEEAGPSVQVVAVGYERTNSVVVSGPADTLELIEEVIRAIDTYTTAVAEVKVFHLKYADARNAADLINEIFQEERQQQDSQQPGPMMMFGRGPGGRGAARSEQEEPTSSVRVMAAADERTNTLVVSGPVDKLEVIEKVVEALDTLTGAEAEVKVFHLEYADADNTADLINEIFQVEERGSSRSQQQTQMPVFFRGGRGEGTQTQSEQDTYSLVEVVAAADERTNSIVVSGPPDKLEVIEGIIKELDANPEQERSIFVYPLKNAEAANLKEILNNLFTEMQTLTEQAVGGGQRFQGQTAAGQMGQRGSTGAATSSTGQSSGGSSGLSDEVYFEADEDTNALLILASSKDYDKIKKVIDDLDKPVPQVLIKVLVAEVTHSDEIDLGTEFSILNVRHDADSTLLQTDFGISAETSGFLFRTIEGDVDVALRALEKVGKLDILSRPYILTSNNQAAIITVGEEVPFIRDTRITETGQTINTIEYEDIGIILEVTPHINPEGLVIMDVKPEISATTAKTVPISEVVSASVFAKRSSESRVAIRDGQTIVIGGLMEDQLTESVKKVPILGDVPILGFLFQRKTKEKEKTELLIFLTPHVATGAEDLRTISEQEKSQSELIEKAVGPGIFEKHMKGMQSSSSSDKK